LYCFSQFQVIKLENNPMYQNNTPFESIKQLAPFSSGAMTIGILSIIFAVLIPPVGLVLGLVALSHARKADHEIMQSPFQWHCDSVSKAQTGRITGIIGLSLGAVMLLITIFYILIFVFVTTIIQNA